MTKHECEYNWVNSDCEECFAEKKHFMDDMEEAHQIMQCACDGCKAMTTSETYVTIKNDDLSRAPDSEVLQLCPACYEAFQKNNYSLYDSKNDKMIFEKR